MIRKRTVKLTTVGGAGAAVATATLTFGRPGFVRAMAVDYDAAIPATTDLVVKADSSGGATLFTNSNANTDITAKPVGMPGIDEGNAALAATDSSAGGWPFGTGLYFSVAQADAVTDGVVVTLWVEL